MVGLEAVAGTYDLVPSTYLPNQVPLSELKILILAQLVTNLGTKKMSEAILAQPGGALLPFHRLFPLVKAYKDSLIVIRNTNLGASLYFIR